MGIVAGLDEIYVALSFERANYGPLNTYAQAKDNLYKAGKLAVEHANKVRSAVGTNSGNAVHNVLGTLSGGATSVSGLSPLTLALSPWISIGKIMWEHSGISWNDLHDLLSPRGKRHSSYPCSCTGVCTEAAELAISRGESRTTELALAATGVLAAPLAIYKAGYNIKKKVTGQKGVVRTEISHALLDAARPMGMLKGKKVGAGICKVPKVMKPGCSKAQAVIAVLLKELDLNKAPNSYSAENFFGLISAMLASDGWYQVKRAI